MFDAIRALHQLGTTDWELRIFGSGDRAAVDRAVLDLGLGNQVEVHGPIGAQELQQELERAHVAILPSYFEAFGLAFAEAQATGLPVIAYRAGSVPEVVLDGATGWLARPQDVDDLGRCIKEAVTDPQRTFAMGMAGRERARGFTWRKTARTILEGLQLRSEP